MALTATRRTTGCVRRGALVVRALVAVAISGSLALTLTPAVAQPVNPSDAEIADAQGQIEAGNGDVSRLAGEISARDGEINRLEMEMGGLREAVNKAVVDLQDAQAEAQRARAEADAAKVDLDSSQADIEAAQERLNELSRAAYRQNGTSKGLSGMSGNSANEDALDRQTYLRTTADKQREAVAELDRLRTENANKESALRVARNLADQREAEAAEQERTTREAIERNSAQVNSLNADRNALVAQRGEAERSLAAARSQADTLQGQRQEYQDYQRAEAERKEAEAAAAAAAEEKRKTEAAEAAARAAAEKAAAEAQAEREAVARAAAEQRAREAQAEAERARAAAEQKAAEDAEAKRVQQAALAAAAAAAAALAAANEAEQTAAASPAQTAPAQTAPAQTAPAQTAPAQTAPAQTAPAQTAPAQTAPAQTAPSPGGTGSGGSGSGSVVDESADDIVEEVVTGDRAARIEAVIARASSQIGMPYAWGGGDANGPTLGIRDGGVADSYGDYNKVGFDCSGLVLYAFAGVGISLPHYTGYQYQHGTKVSPSSMQRGDLIFYGPGASQHVAIYLGNGQMLEAPQSGSTVRISPVRWSGMTEYAVRLL
ncbi:DIP1281 family NlpC/P60 protein [Corynebacterium pacaense]|uniref:DIP1281 family NlpC/P60 protein n=1 Tax=Corynebacterium pacaense TaxID=1816684 RepID=UPI0009BBD501|nr:NlpC/P60 family protein [Corynebacterium pacaense]